ncbi:Lrp/AsnC family transcriptional regulator [Kibdelosporangium aridum]|uniref:Lrp/AsnC family transcriptional regulator, leucine-responsive regulatory protein n=1 Tax=Kibdelosporangium aridum TaxID=2030 RepID=A0A1W2FJ29_KIBAR|nr:Lrp/AsnC family transcriptional regulator [Kibdelosporangium aridum]SMD21716.1 Lrp/AsnC family transcriptional regulator, leucine-responsive regulatory protein [Kibdelosporangium aridum]
MDGIDKVILGELVRDGRVSFRDLAERVRLSPTATAERVRKLQESGVISGFRAEVDMTALGRPLKAFIDVRLRPGPDHAELEAALLTLPAVLSGVHVTGRWDYTLTVACRDVAELDELVMALPRSYGVVETNTRLLLRELAGSGAEAVTRLLG